MEGIYNFLVNSFASFLTYMTFKNVKIEKKTKEELALMYIIIYVYTLIYIFITLCIWKWLSNVIRLTFNYETGDKGFSSLMKSSFKNSLYVLPFYVILTILSYTLDINIMYSKNMFCDKNKKCLSPNFQAYTCIIFFIITYCSKNKPDIEHVELVRYLLLAITGMSLLKNSIPANYDGTIDRITATIVNVIVNFNWNLLMILLPFILFFAFILVFVFMKQSDIEMWSYIILILFICLSAFIMVCIFQASYKKNFLKIAQKFLFDKIVIKSLLSWVFTTVIYSLPLFIISFAKTGKTTEIWDIVSSVFNYKFGNILIFIIAIMYSFEKLLHINDKINILVNLFIFLNLMISHITQK